MPSLICPGESEMETDNKVILLCRRPPKYFEAYYQDVSERTLLLLLSWKRRGTYPWRLYRGHTTQKSRKGDQQRDQIVIEPVYKSSIHALPITIDHTMAVIHVDCPWMGMEPDNFTWARYVFHLDIRYLITQAYSECRKPVYLVWWSWMANGINVVGNCVSGHDIRSTHSKRLKWNSDRLGVLLPEKLP